MHLLKRTNSMPTWFDEFNRLFNGENPVARTQSGLDEYFKEHDWLPRVDVKDEKENFVIFVDLPGLSEDEVEIEVEDRQLIIRGSRESSNKSEEEGYIRVERVSGSFSRAFTLPDNADTDNIHAQMRDGVLEITIKKKSVVQGKKVKIAKK